MPKTKDSNREAYQLLYRNGQTTVSGQVDIPRFSDICLTKETQDDCDAAIRDAEKCEAPIRSDAECQKYIDRHSVVDRCKLELQELEKNDRKRWLPILSQISAAIDPTLNKLIVISDQLRKRIAEWRNMVLEGKRREEERLRAAAEEKRNEAKYTDDPKKRRKATVQAKQLEEEAKSIAPKPEKGIDTEEYWEGEITNRLLAAKMPEEIVTMDIDQQKLNQRIKALSRAGEKITPNMFPGIELTRKTRVKFHK
jgi:hypothetical protein